jgi:hypothetical protein
MKVLYLIGALMCCVGLSQAGASSGRLGDTTNTLSAGSESARACPPTVYDCCDGVESTSCSSHGGVCGIAYRCGIPY